MNTLQKIVCAGVESMGGGGGVPKFFDRMIESLSDYQRSVLANKLSVEMPDLLEKFSKMGKPEAWWLSQLVEHRWKTEIPYSELLKQFKLGINDPGTLPGRPGRRLDAMLDRVCPGWTMENRFVSNDEKKIEIYLLGDLDDRRRTFLGLYPNAKFLAVDEGAMAEIAEAESEAAEVEAEANIRHKKRMAVFPQIRHLSGTMEAEYEIALGVVEHARAKSRNEFVTPSPEELQKAEAEFKVVEDKWKAARRKFRDAEAELVRDFDIREMEAMTDDAEAQ